MSIRRLLLMAGALVITSASVLVAAIASASPPTNPHPRDPRLDKKLTFSRQHIRLGELVEQIGNETGTRLEVDDRFGPASGFILTASFRERPAHKIMSALARLYTAPPDRWYWERSGKPDSPRYLLRHTLRLEAAGSAREAFIEDWLVKQHLKTQRFAVMSLEERKRAATADPYLEAVNKNPLRSLGKASILGLLSESELRSAIRGNAIEIPLTRLSTEQRDWWRREHEYYMQTADSSARALILRREPGEDSLELNLGGSISVCAIGGTWIRKPLEEFGQGEWIAADESTEPEDRQFPATGIRFTPEELVLQPASDSIHARRLSHLGRVDVLLDESRGGTHGAVVGLSPRLKDALIGLREVGLLSKRWGSIYMLRPKDWASQSTRSLVDWPSLKALRASADARDGYLRSQDWLTLSEMGQAQLVHLQEEFPDAAYILQFQPLFRLVGQMSAKERELLARAEGGGWNDFSSATRQRMLVLFAPSDARLVRLHLRWIEDEKPPAARLYSGIDPPAPVRLEFKRRIKPVPDKEEGLPVQVAM